MIQNSLLVALPCCTIWIMITVLSGCEFFDRPPTEDSSVWEEVIEPGFGSSDNYAVVAMAEYQGRLYAMTRNETEGAEIWRTADKTWEQVPFPNGETNGIYDNPWISCLWGSMIVFRDKLYCGFSSGHQGSVFDSTGCEIWSYDGSSWEPIISDKKDTEESGVISGISGCEDADGDVTSQITDRTKNWEKDQWSGGILQITSGSGKFRRFDIVSNTKDALVIQQNEVAGNINEEYTICGNQHFSNPFPPYEYDRGSVEVGDSYAIGTGSDENGFGDYWNKMIPEMIIFGNKLYVSTALNYDYGAQVWYTEDGDTWVVTEPTNSFGNFHSDPGYLNSQKPVSTSIPSLCISTVSGEPVLYAGGTGASGNKGRCSRMARLTDTGWELIVDASIDDNDEGTNENGFGGGMDCSMWNGDFMPWSLAEFNDTLYVGIQSLAGTRVLYTPTGSSEDGSWLYSVGGDSDVPNGFDGKKNPGNPRMYQNIASNLFPYKGQLYAGLISVYAPTIGATQKELTGAQLWKTSDGSLWYPVTLNGFGDKHIIGIEAFAVFNDTLYVSVNKGSVDSPHGLEPPEGGKIFKLVSSSTTSYPSFDNINLYKTIIPQNGDPTDIYYPRTDDLDNSTFTFPIALLLQGGRVDKSYYSKYANHVARYGFIVVVPNHISTFSVPGYSAEGLFSEQQQIYDVLAFMAEENVNAASPVFGLVDTHILVMLGHSYGAACSIGAIQNTCEYPFCPEGEEFTRPEELKAVALCGINTKPYGVPFDKKIRKTHNQGMPMAFINGDLDSHATYYITKISYELIQDPPKALIFLKGANHYAICNINNPPGPAADKNEPILNQEVAIETAARWSALFLRAHALNDREALEYIYKTGNYLDVNVEVETDLE